MTAISHGSGDVATVLARYGRVGAVDRVTGLDGAGGYSGALFWRLESPAGPLCLRRWPPEHPMPQRLAWIHRVLQHVHDQGFRPVPRPLKSDEGDTYVTVGRALWELTPWLPGTADFALRPNALRLSAAMAALATFHRSAATFPRGPSQGPAPAVVERRDRLRHWLDGELDELLAAASLHPWNDLRSRAQHLRGLVRATAPRALALLDGVRETEITLAPVIRDIHDEHVLFTGDEVTGLVDFGAMRIDTRVADLTRLLGSMSGDDRQAWSRGREAYDRIAPLSADEEALIRPLDDTAVVLSPLNWIDWIARRQRRFAEPTRVLARIDRYLARLENLARHT